MIAMAAMLLAAAPPPLMPPPVQRSESITVFRSIVIRMPVIGRRAAPPPPMAFVEKKGPKCIEARDIAGAAVASPDAVDFALRGGDRVRARLESACPALDYYRGFYLSPGRDGRVCVDRDVIRTRAGGECGIDRFRRLVPPKPPRP